MTFKLDLHPIQLSIIRDLALNTQLRFRDLNIDKLPTDQFSFHLNQLIRQDLISKTPRLKYELTTQGKIVAEFVDTRIAQFEDQAKLSAVVISSKGENGQQLILLQKRLKHPYYGYWGFISGKIRKGELPLEAAKRELLEETGLHAKSFQFKGINHKMDYNKQGEILADKYFFVYQAN